MRNLWPAIFVVIGAGLMMPVDSAGAASKDPKHVIVDIVRIEGEQFHMRDEAGTEAQIHVGGDTEQYGQFKPGDRIDAWIFPNGHAKTLMIVRSAMIMEEDKQRHQREQQQTQR